MSPSLAGGERASSDASATLVARATAAESRGSDCDRRRTPRSLARRRCRRRFLGGILSGDWSSFDTRRVRAQTPKRIEVTADADATLETSCQATKLQCGKSYGFRFLIFAFYAEHERQSGADRFFWIVVISRASRNARAAPCYARGRSSNSPARVNAAWRIEWCHWRRGASRSTSPMLPRCTACSAPRALWHARVGSFNLAHQLASNTVSVAECGRPF